MRTSNGRRSVGIVAGAVLAGALLLPAGVASAQSVDGESLTLVVEIPERTATPTPSPTATIDPTPWPQPSSSSTAAPGNGASGQLPATGGEGLLWLLVAGGAITAVGLTIRGAARSRQSSTSPRS
ncbi:LPXTG cell wall anchor domain-containing protein [Microbacterium sp. Gd 4-13]|uniref:LPXTG cell wall anchor domain-containing protein n=1 Tax=Microbacterium sp. Gd 4-13 TaxID=2173179 RepID=UPI001403FC19|nr:LPXTG cell wall anchor domain-containing protein [Microbacterium sp. Gd 4-13]